MIERTIEPKLRDLARYYPVVLVTGPRQSGKTTLCRKVFPDKTYLSFEALDTREFALSDPRGFLAQYADGAILDEIKVWMDEHEYESIAQMRGSMSQQSVADPSAFERANYMKVLRSY